MSSILRHTQRRSEYSQFCWTPECQTAFDNIKAYLAQPPILSKAQPHKTLYVYLAASDNGFEEVATLLLGPIGRFAFRLSTGNSEAESLQ